MIRDNNSNLEPKSALFPPLSYILTSEKLSFVDELVREKMLPCGRNLYHTAQLSFGIAFDAVSGNYVAPLGLVIDVDSATIDNTNIANLLLRLFSENEAAYWDAIDRISGRYVIIYGNSYNKESWIIGDCFGSLKITFCKLHDAVSSNIFLINQFFEGGVRNYSPLFKDQRKSWKYGSLGQTQPLTDYEILTPNHALDLSSYTIHRFYPRSKKSNHGDVKLVVNGLIDNVRKQSELLNHKYNLFQSLTAGLDSRISLAVNDCIEDTVFFTYLFNEAHRIDARVSVDIADRLDLRHCILTDSPKLANDSIDDLKGTRLIVTSSNKHLIYGIKVWDWCSHGNRVVSAYHDGLLPNYDLKSKVPLHIRSHLWETTRIFWGKNEIFSSSEILKNSRRDWLAHEELFNRYFIDSEYEDAATLGFNLLDIFYWEHRCGTWVSEVYQGTDFAFNTHSFINCRTLVESMIGLDFSQRKNADAFRRVIDVKLPKISDIPINPKS